jgi:hypothetical protein
LHAFDVLSVQKPWLLCISKAGTEFWETQVPPLAVQPENTSLPKRVAPLFPSSVSGLLIVTVSK